MGSITLAWPPHLILKIAMTALHCTTPGKPAFALALSDLMVASMLEQEEPIVPGNTTQISPHRVFADPRDTLAIIHVLTWQSYQGDG